MKALVFPGQGSQFSGMGKDLYDASASAKKMFERADEVLGFGLSEIMFSGTDEDLKQTKVTQPAVFLHSVVMFYEKFANDSFDMVAGHSLGEFSALVAAGVLSFEDALVLVSKRAMAMQKACEMQKSTMAAVIRLDRAIVERICAETDGIVVPANYNSPEQIVISGSEEAIDAACVKMKEAGAKRALKLQVGGAFHSPLMEPAREELAKAIMSTNFNDAKVPIYQNVDAMPHRMANEIRENLVKQLTSAVRWSDSVVKMHEDGADEFIEVGPGQVLTGLVAKILQ
ncbi:MAG: ACP S-malonyltransferase [Bacteroidales bacterium]|jgi:[acyl-carrier-protein] S-malonyltransferase|nr:ACP S-malonyltransferase [Bacteroidales bacterium]